MIKALCRYFLSPLYFATRHPLNREMEWTPISVLVPIIPIMIKTGYFIPLIVFLSTGSEKKKSFKNVIPLNFFISLDTVGKVIENFAPLKISRKIFVPLKFPGKIFRPLKKYSERVSGVKNDRPLRYNSTQTNLFCTRTLLSCNKSWWLNAQCR